MTSSRRMRAFLTVQKHNPGRSHVERQTEQGRDQQDGGEYRRSPVAECVDRDQQHDNRQRDVESEQGVEAAAAGTGSVTMPSNASSSRGMPRLPWRNPARLPRASPMICERLMFNAT